MWLTEAEGTPVLSRDDAERLGSVRRLLVDVPARCVTALHIDGRKRKALLVDWDALTGFGPDAAVVRARDTLRGPADDELAFVSGDLDWLGRRVLTDLGDGAGTVRDLEFDESTGALRSLETDTGTYPAEAVVTLGPYCVIVRDQHA